MRLFSVLSRYLVRLGCWLFLNAVVLITKAVQYPRVAREFEPKFLSDETINDSRGDVFAIVVKYAKFGVSADFLDLLAALKRADVNSIVVCNGSLSQAEHDALRKNAHRILVRENIGRDMGAYRAATLYVAAAGLKPLRMIYFNDSLIYLKGLELDALITQLMASDYDMIGVFENHQIKHHIGSYAFSISGKIFTDENVLRFWKKYRPYDLRPYAINQGEIAYSDMLKKNGYRADVLYGIDKLSRHLSALHIEKLIALIRYMRPAFRMQSLDHILAQPVIALELVPKIRKSQHPLPASAPISSGTPKLSEYRVSRAFSHASQSVGERDLDIRQAADVLARQTLVDLMMWDIACGSQIHLGFGLFHKVMNCPLVKKDLLFRGIYFEHDCELILDQVPEERRNHILRELINRGRPVSLHWYRRLQMHLGLI